jgi:hypothetical protein
MTYSFYVKKQRAQHIVNELRNRAKIVSEEDKEGFVKVEMNINSDYDLLCLFHAGVKAGMTFE